MTQDNLTRIGQLLATADGQLFATQYAIGRILVAEVGTDLKPGAAKGEPGKGRQGFRRQGGLNTACTALAEAHKRRGRSAAWFKLCYYIAKGFTPAQYEAMLAQQPTQDAVMRLMYRKPAEIDAAIGKGGLGHDSRRKAVAHDIHDGQGDAPDEVTINAHWEPEAIADKVAYLITRVHDHDRRGAIVREITDVLRRVQP